MRQNHRMLYVIFFGSIIFCLVCIYIITAPNESEYSGMDYRTNLEFIVEEKNDTLWQDMRRLTARAYLDATMKYKILPHVQLATHWHELSMRPLCVASQSSLDRAGLIVELATNWPGIINLALFVPGPELPLALYYLEYLKRCYPVVEERVTIHFAYPLRNKFEEHLEDLYTTMRNWTCEDNPDTALNYLRGFIPDKIMNQRKKLLYPQNMLRNVARDHCQNEWITCVDMDMLFPSPDNGQHRVAESLEQFLNSSQAMSCKNCALVLPTYEIQSNVSKVPRNKTELLQFVEKGDARQFHKATYPDGQEMSDLDTWEKFKPSTKVSIAYPAKPFKWKYEPIYIARRGTPRFDERYVGFGSDRLEQVYEMFLNDYKFQVLNNVFLTHRGFKYPGYIDEERRKQMKTNFNEFCRHHLKELTIKYNKDPLHLLQKYAINDKNEMFELSLRRTEKSSKRKKNESIYEK